jgi:hypothetical protein
MAMSVDTDLQSIVPDILDLGIASFSSEHAKAKADIERRLRREWWPNKGLAGELNTTLLTESQFTRTAAYLVLWKYALPQLTTWVADDRFKIMLDHYREMYESEFQDVLEDGVEYDYNDDDVISVSERAPVHMGRLVR